MNIQPQVPAKEKILIQKIEKKQTPLDPPIICKLSTINNLTFCTSERFFQRREILSQRSAVEITTSALLSSLISIEFSPVSKTTVFFNGTAIRSSQSK